MHSSSYKRLALGALISATLSIPAYAQNDAAATTATEDAEVATPAQDVAAFQSWLTEFRTEALGKGITAATLDRILPTIQQQRRVIEADRNQAEFVETYADYLERVSPRRIEMGQQLMVDHSEMISAAAQAHGVQPRFVAAILGMESNYGTFPITEPLFNVIATLAYDSRRPEQFRAQLLAAFEIVDKGYATAEMMKSSWAGALGAPQFMPDSYLRLAVDEDGDGTRDLWRMGPDVIGLFNRLRTFAYGASPMPPALLGQALKDFPNTDFVQVYGLTEVCGAVTVLSPQAHRDESHPERLTSAGQPALKVEVKVVNPDTLEDVPQGQPGELWFRTPQLMDGYHNKPDATKEAVTEDGWFRTGDIGRVDDGGFVFVEDRLKDMIISGGENIYSVEVERALTDHPAVGDAAVFGIPDEKWGESVKAVVELSAGQEVSPEELIAWCKEKLAGYKCPRSVEIMVELPRNPTGKLLKKDLRKPYWENRDRAI